MEAWWFVHISAASAERMLAVKITVFISAFHVRASTEPMLYYCPCDMLIGGFLTHKWLQNEMIFEILISVAASLRPFILLSRAAHCGVVKDHEQKYEYKERTVGEQGARGDYDEGHEEEKMGANKQEQKNKGLWCEGNG